MQDFQFVKSKKIRSIMSRDIITRAQHDVCLCVHLDLSKPQGQLPFHG